MKEAKPTNPPIVDDHVERAHPFIQRGFMPGVKHAWHGVMHVVNHEKNARVHLGFAVLALITGLLLNVSKAELAAVFFVVIIVFLAEIFNTAIERILDLVEPRQNERVKLIKDMSAGGVLVAAVGAVMMGAAIFVPAIVRLIWGV
jgi:diacylglycerol kinase